MHEQNIFRMAVGDFFIYIKQQNCYNYTAMKVSRLVSGGSQSHKNKSEDKVIVSCFKGFKHIMTNKR